MKITLRATLYNQTPLLLFFSRDPRFIVEERDLITFFIYPVSDYKNIWLDYQRPFQDHTRYEEDLDLSIYGWIPDGLLFHQLFRESRELCELVIGDPSLLPELANNLLGLSELAQEYKRRQE